jgi:hypothetical protein
MNPALLRPARLGRAGLSSWEMERDSKNQEFLKRPPSILACKGVTGVRPGTGNDINLKKEDLSW